MATELLVKLISGAEQTGAIIEGFNPAADRLELFRADRDGPSILALSEICYIKFLGQPDWADHFSEDEFFENVTTVTGEEFHLRLKKGENHPRGFFGYPTEIESNFTKIFFIKPGLQSRRHEQPIGEVLHQTGLIDESELKQARQVQDELRSRRVGEILSDQVEVPQIVVDQAISNARQHVRRAQVKVGDILIEAGLVTPQQVDKAIAEQTSGKRKRIGTILVEKGLITEDQLLTALAQKVGLRRVDLEQNPPAPEAIKRLSREVIERMQVLPIEVKGKQLVVATSTPTDPTISENLRFATNARIELVVARAKQISEKIAEHFAAAEHSVGDLIEDLVDDLDVVVDEEPEAEKVTESDSKVINLVNKVLLEAYQGNISDIHFEPGMGTQPMRIRYRRDGICYTLHQIAATYKAAIISRIKIIAKLDIAEHRRPQ